MIRVHQVLNIFMSWIYNFIYKNIFKKFLVKVFNVFSSINSLLAFQLLLI